MKNIFTGHPHSLGETYLQHFKFALSFGLSMVGGGLACIIHAIFPFMFKKTGSDILLSRIHHFIERMPTVEDRIIYLSEKIETKRENCKLNSKLNA